MTDTAIDPRLFIAPSVSDAARARLEQLRAWLVGLPTPTVPETLADFDAAAARSIAFAERLNRAALDALQPVTAERTIGGVPVLEVCARDHADDGTVIVYVHGGGFVQGSARSYLLTAALAASTSRRRVISIDYTLAPRGTWSTIRDQVTTVWSALLNERTSGSLGMMGDSAGGCIAAAATLWLRDHEQPMPAALVLLSPATDLASGGDTNVTLAAVDYLDGRMRRASRDAYAPGADLTDPLVSPVHGDFTPGYPPVLLQVGTRELLLSDSVRLHRALNAAGQTSRLELYEGMPHVFQPLFADAPEGRQAWAEMAGFWAEHLRS